MTKPAPFQEKLAKLKFILDENVPLSIFKKLQTAGVDCILITEIQKGATDRKVLQIAKEQEKILVTFDKDFGYLIFRENVPIPKGIILLKFPMSSPEDSAERFWDFIVNYAERLEGNFIVVEENQIRIRSLPK